MSIAGDPASLPSDAELARTLVARHRRATLSTLTTDGYPFGSAVSYVADVGGAPVLLISEMAEHTRNLRGDDRASVLVNDQAPAAGDPLAASRLTLVGRLRPLARPGPVRQLYLEAHPYAASYIGFGDFGFWRLEVEACRYVGGFGRMSWVDAAAYAGAEVDPLAPAAAGIVAHMNDDHAEANLAYVQHLAGVADATGATLVGIDRYGLTLQAVTPEGSCLARVAFPAPLRSADEARPAIVALLRTARPGAG